MKITNGNGTVNDPYVMFDLRCKLTSDLILRYKHLPRDKGDILLELIKSDIEEDLVLAQEIMKQLAI